MAEKQKHFLSIPKADYIYTSVLKNITSKAKSYENIVYILLLYVYNFNFICRESEKKKKKMTSRVLYNYDVFNYGSKISFFKISIISNR